MEQHPQTVPEIGLVGRLVRVFTAPAEAFEAVVGRHSWHDWVIPVVVVAIGSTVSVQLTMDVILKTQRQAVAAAQSGMTAQERANSEQAMEMMSGVTEVITLVSAPLSILLFALVFAAVYLLVGRYYLGGEVSYPQMLVVEGYATIIGLPQLLVMTLLRQAKGEMIMALGPGLLLGDEMLSTFVGRMLNLVDIFMLWQILVAAIGLAVFARATVGKALSALLAIWLVYLVVAAGLGGLGPGS